MEDRNWGRARRTRPLGRPPHRRHWLRHCRLLPALASHGANAIGIDSDPAMPALAASRGPVIQADAHRLPLADASLDAATPSDGARHPAWRAAGRGRPQPGQPVGTARQARTPRPYTTGCFLPRADLLALGRRHRRVRMQGLLFAAGRLLALPAPPCIRIESHPPAAPGPARWVWVCASLAREGTGRSGLSGPAAQAPRHGRPAPIPAIG
jgi:hypothetical protein